MKSAEIRQAFLDFFAEHEHEIVSSSSLVPENDPTLLFTNAGMVQFKDAFLGKEKRSYTRATSAQRVVRAGGKHNDLENVGYTARHHTFFEMLGNFSFGDYFKREAIQYAWDFLTKRLGLSEDKLWVTVYKDDSEAENIWLNEMKISPDRFSRLGEADNFWSMGDTGPCGPCTEIFYDHGPAVAGGPPGSPEEDGDRYIEIWNLVFMQFNRQAGGEMMPLPKPSVDTGMGLERIAAVMQGVHNNYEIDLFVNLLRGIAEVTGVEDITQTSLRVIADHIRSCAFLIVDGVLPSNEGRGYVLRRIIRRAIRHGNKLGIEGEFFARCMPALVLEMSGAYPELVSAQSHVEKVLRIEEEQFAKTLEQGLKILEKDLSTLKGDVIPGETAFVLYDTYGFPVDLTADIAREKNLTVDMAGFEAAMQAQRKRSQEKGGFANDYLNGLGVDSTTDFLGYDETKTPGKIVQMFVEGESVEKISSTDLQGKQVVLVLNQTPFYAESGGQVGDRGDIKTTTGLFLVKDTQKEGDAVLHFGELASGELQINDEVDSQLEEANREAIRLNHSATHLMHAALRQVLGEHVAQKGSLVDANRLRFDFSNLEGTSESQLQEIEDRVNHHIRSNTLIRTEILDIESAKKKGAMALFGEKYSEEVRVLTMGEAEFSIELCGGTHANRTGDIGLFKIISETGIAAGIRRIEAVTGANALAWVNQGENNLRAINLLFKSSRDEGVGKVQLLMSRSRELEKEIDALKGKLASSAGDDLSDLAVEVKGTKILAAVLEGVDPKSLRDTVDQLKNKLGSAIVVLAIVKDGKVQLVAGVTKENTKKVKAGALVNFVAQQIGGKGGGRPDMAMAGATNADGLVAALDSVVSWCESQL
ncbi:MAG: alanine--tRNA ligase [Pseudomonadales bacterium]|nr:alanine--tRNA ligase [Pseudomonadales bacterium]